MRWFELNASSGFINIDSGLAVTAYQSGGTWRLKVSGATEDLKGNYASQSDAHNAARKICQGIDPSTLV